MKEEKELLSDTTRKGDRIASLIALREKLAAAIDCTDSGRDLALLATRLVAVLAELDQLGVGVQPESPADAIAARWAARRQAR